MLSKNVSAVVPELDNEHSLVPNYKNASLTVVPTKTASESSFFRFDIRGFFHSIREKTVWFVYNIMP